MLVVSAIEVGQPPIPAAIHVSNIEEAVDALIGAPGDVLLLASADELSRASRVARAVINQPNVGLVSIDGTPTQRAAAARFVAALPVEAYGVAQELSNAVLRISRTYLALSSVAGLTAATPSLGQHLRSWFPGASFDVDLSAGTVTSSKPVVWEPPANTLLCWAESAKQAKLKVELLGRPAGLTLPPSTAKKYNAREWAELTVIEDGGRLLRSLYLSIQTVPCKGCTRSVPATICIFCGTVPQHANDPRTLNRSMQ